MPAEHMPEAIPMVDLAAQYRRLGDAIEAAVTDVLASTRYILGPNVEAFENEAAGYLGVRHALGCASGTDALHLALKAAGIGAGDEVITTPFTFIATAEAIRYVGARPVFVDIAPDSFNIDPAGLEDALTERTRAVLPVHLFGRPADMAAIRQFATRHRLAVIEDCAQSFGARYDGRMTGSLGLAGAFSFFPSKNLGGCGDGGLITTDDDDLAETVRMLRNHGRRIDGYQHEVIGYNSRLDELQAAVLRVKLRHVDDFNRGRQRVAEAYRRWLSDPHIERPGCAPSSSHVYHQYTILVPEHARESIMARLRAAGIASAIYYPMPLHRQPAFADARYEALPVAEAVSRRCLSLPMYPELSDEHVQRIADCVLAAVHANGDDHDEP